jgi:dCTP deaminase
MLMILSDRDIKQMIANKCIQIEPLSPDTIQQNGIDLKLGDKMATTPKSITLETIDSSSSEEIKKAYIILASDNNKFAIEPSKHYLFTTEECITMPNDVMGFIGLRSTFARLGFVSPLTIVDAGFEGTLTVGVFYGGSIPINLPVGCRFLHVVLGKLQTPAEMPYEGHYKKQQGVSLPKALV